MKCKIKNKRKLWKLVITNQKTLKKRNNWQNLTLQERIANIFLTNLKNINKSIAFNTRSKCFAE